jgi:hypothetical protein
MRYPAAILPAVGLVVAGVAAAIISLSLFICRRRRLRTDEGTGRSAPTSRRVPPPILGIAVSIFTCASEPINLTLDDPEQPLLGGEDLPALGSWNADCIPFLANESTGDEPPQSTSISIADQAPSSDFMPAAVLRGRNSPRAGQNAGADPPRRQPPPLDRIGMALLIDEARTLEKNSKAFDVPLLQRAAAKYQEAASNIESFVEQQERRSGCDESAMKDLLEKSSMYAKQGEELYAQASSLTSIPLEEDLDPEEFAGSRDSESGTLPPAGGEVQVTVKFRGAVPYSKTHVRQHDRQRVSCESLDDIPDLALEIDVPAWWSDSESLAHETPESVTLLDQDLVNNHEGKSECLDFAGYCQDEYDEYPSGLESISSDASFHYQEFFGGEPPQKKSKGETIEVDEPITGQLADCDSEPAAVMQDESDLESNTNGLSESAVLLAQESTRGKPRPLKSGWELDYDRKMEPTDDDVLCGRGGHANRHPGNVLLRKDALELLPAYISSSDKTQMSVELMESVTNKGHHFLGKGQDNMWYRVIDPRNKVRQIFTGLAKVPRNAAPSPNNSNQAKSEESEVASPRSVAVGCQDIDQILDHQAAEGLDDTILIDELPNCQPHAIDGTSRLVMDESCPIEYTDGDVLFGKGGKINKHPGNVRFRQKAEELSERYESCSKENKKVVALELVDSVTSEGNFFLAMGPGRQWYPVVNEAAPRTKASQLFREIREARRNNQ